MSSALMPFDRRPVPRVGAMPDAQIHSLRDQFLAAPETTDLSGLRPVIARSWQRSLACNVTTNGVFIEASDTRADEQFLLAAEPALTELERLCADTGGSVVLTDADGTLAVFRGDAAERRKAEKVFPTLGGRFGEDLVGTNSDGTVLEEGEAVQVWGAEHFNEALQNSYCTSVPVRDPIRRSIRGVLGVMLPESLARSIDPRSVLLTVNGAAAEITRRLGERLAAREQALMSEYMREVRKRGSDAVIAMDDRTTIASRSALSVLDQSDFAVLAALARENGQGEATHRRLNVSSGREVMLQIRPMDLREVGAGGAAVIRLQMRAASGRTRSTVTERPASGRFEGFVGSSRPLRRALDAAETAVSRRMPAYIVGEQGTGKLRLAEAIAAGFSDEVWLHDFSRPHPGTDLVDVVDAALARGAAVVLHRIERSSPGFKDDFAALLKVLEQPQIAITAGQVGDDLLPVLSGLRGIEVTMPALRERRDDIPALANHFLAASRGRATRLSPKLRDALVLADWPGNVGQLRNLLESVAAHSEWDEARLSDVPEVQLRALSTMMLTRLEEAELQQIRETLAEAGGNRVHAAALLGIGRSTLYRKIEIYEGRGFTVELG